MENGLRRPEDLSQQELAGYVILLFHQVMMHHGLYFSEVVHQFGMEKSLPVMDRAWEKSYAAQMRRLSKVLGFTMENNIPQPLLGMTRGDLLSLIKALGTNWLTADGIWFQEVEKEYTVQDAQRCAGGCIGKFCAFEAWSIRRFLQLPSLAGLEGLKEALHFRPYHQINTQSLIDEGANSVIFQMNDCIVQKTRKQKGLSDYPCKSSGIVEYRTFAQIIDPRIAVECIGCPPDEHPDEWYCAWRFVLKEDGPRT